MSTSSLTFLGAARATSDTVRLPVVLESVQAGFPSPAQDYVDAELDLNEHLIRDRTATYIWRAAGHSMIRAGIFDGDLLLVDRGITATAGHIVIAVVDGEYTVKRWGSSSTGEPVLHSENPSYPDVIIDDLSDVRIWGVVTWVLHQADLDVPTHARRSAHAQF